MRVLLILRSEKTLVSGRIVVVRTNPLADRVIFLLEENKAREVVDLLNKKIIPEVYVPSGGRFDGHNVN